MNLQAPLVKRPATYQDVIDAPEDRIAEIVNGALLLLPRPSFRHANASFCLASKLGEPFRFGRGGPGGWLFGIEPELHLGPDVLIPDVAGWRRERLSKMPEGPAVDVAPDWLCEVLSPSTREYDLSEKRELYGRYGVGWLWFVDPLARTLEVFRNDDGWRLVKTLHGAEEVRQPPFDAIAFPLDALWPDFP